MNLPAVDIVCLRRTRNTGTRGDLWVRFTTGQQDAQDGGSFSARIKDSVEDDLAHGQTPGPRSFPGVIGRRHAAETVATRKDHSAEKTEQGRLHHCQGMEADLTARHIRQDPGVSGGRKDLARSGDPRPAPDQSLRGPKAAVRGASTLTPTGANLRSVAGATGAEPDQL